MEDILQINKNIANFGVSKNYPAMQKKTSKTDENKRDIASEPVMDYQKSTAETSCEWNPNIPFHGTQEKWGNISMRLKRESLYLGMKLKKNLHNGRRITSQTG